MKTKWVLRDPLLRQHVPRTLLFTKDNLISMLSTCSRVYFKPTGGSGGFSIIRITRAEQGYQTQWNKRKMKFRALDGLYKHLRHFSKGRSFLLQKGIHLARSAGKPFDIRVMVQKTNAGKWVSSALFMKIGATGKVATNYNQGGRIGFYQPTMSRAGFKKEMIQHTEMTLNKMGVATGKAFDSHKKGFRELGLDVAITAQGKPWILEVNTRPQFYPLKKMGDRKVYRRIIALAKQYGRTK